MDKSVANPCTIQPGEAICQIKELAERKSLRFALRTPKGLRGAFLIRYEGQFYGYLNRCLHVPMELDYDTNDFFTGDGCHLLCQTHGALYEPETGHCTGGPPIGLSLFPVKIAVRGTAVYLEQRPEDFPPDALD